jgi:hypothetical protein
MNSREIGYDFDQEYSQHERRVLVNKNVNLLGEDGFKKLMLMFNRKTFEGSSSNISVEIREILTKSFLENIPDYIEAATKAGVSSDQSYQLLYDSVNLDPYADMAICGEKTRLLTEVFKNESEFGRKVAKEDIKNINGFFKTSLECEVADWALYSFILGQKIGFSISQNIETNFKIMDSDRSLAGYTYDPYLDMLRSLLISHTDPEIIIKVIKE